MTNYNAYLNQPFPFINGREAFPERRTLFLESLERRTSLITINSAAGCFISGCFLLGYFKAYTGSELVKNCEKL